MNTNFPQQESKQFSTDDSSLYYKSLYENQLKLNQQLSIQLNQVNDKMKKIELEIKKQDRRESSVKSQQFSQDLKSLTSKIAVLERDNKYYKTLAQESREQIARLEKRIHLIRERNNSELRLGEIPLIQTKNLLSKCSLASNELKEATNILTDSRKSNHNESSESSHFVKYLGKIDQIKPLTSELQSTRTLVVKESQRRECTVER